MTSYRYTSLLSGTASSVTLRSRAPPARMVSSLGSPGRTTTWRRSVVRPNMTQKPVSTALRQTGLLSVCAFTWCFLAAHRATRFVLTPFFFNSTC